MNPSQCARFSHHMHPLPRLQQGMATMLIILLIGVGTVAISLGSMYMIRSTQERQVAAHAQVNAQSGAWAAVEAMRQYLLTLDAAAVAALPVNKTWTLSGYTGFTQTARINSVTGPVTVDGKEAYRINMHISATAAAAQSSSVLEVVYQILPGAAAPVAPNLAAVNYYGDLTLTGGIDILKDAGNTTPYEINVDGNVAVRNTTVTGVDVIRSTGSVEINGATSFFESVFANCDVSVSGATAPKVIKTTRHICLTNTNRSGYPVGDRNSVDMLANGSIILDGGTTIDGVSYGHNNVWALAGKGGHSYCAAEAKTTLCDDPSQPWLSGISSIFGADAVNPTASAIAGGVYAVWSSKTSVIRSNNDIIIQGTATTDQLHAERNIQYLNAGGTVSTYARHGGDMITAATWIYDGLFGVNNSSGKDQKVAFTEQLIPASRVSLQPEKFDVRNYKDYANYVFSIDTLGRQRVRVRDVKKADSTPLDFAGDETITDGLGYFLLFRDRLCKNPAAANADDVSCVANVGLGYSTQNNLVGYDENNRKWNLAGTSLAPGIAYFEGNLDVGSGTYYNTFLATGNITTSGSSVIYAPNFAGETGRQGGITYAPQGICVNSIFPDLKPTQFCKATGFDYNVAQKIGNYGLMSGTCGGINNCTNAQYIGGDIFTGASTNIFGAVRAGNMFVSSGDTTVHGYISALAQGIQNSNHALSAKTTVDLRNLPAGYDPSGGGNPSSPTGPSAPAEVSVLWSRYL